jgi:SecD/SecF fusion protein
MNDGMNQTLARTMNTSGTTLAVLIVIFLFGGAVIRGFTFALLMGVLFGTYSSVFNATPIAYDLLHGDRQLKEAESGEKTVSSKKKKK